jgi:hypothetical protein
MRRSTNWFLSRRLYVQRLAWMTRRCKPSTLRLTARLSEDQYDFQLGPRILYTALQIRTKGILVTKVS